MASGVVSIDVSKTAMPVSSTTQRLDDLMPRQDLQNSAWQFSHESAGEVCLHPTHSHPHHWIELFSAFLKQGIYVSNLRAHLRRQS